MLVFHKALKSWHLMTAFCRQGTERKRRRLAEEEARVGSEAEITAYGITHAPVTSFKYLGRVISVAEFFFPEVVSNLRKAWWKWAQLTKVLRREGEDARTLGQIFLAVVQLVLLYGSETWVTNSCIGRVLGGFHHRVACRLTRRQPQQGIKGVWL